MLGRHFFVRVQYSKPGIKQILILIQPFFKTLHFSVQPIAFDQGDLPVWNIKSLHFKHIGQLFCPGKT